MQSVLRESSAVKVVQCEGFTTVDKRSDRSCVEVTILPGGSRSIKLTEPAAKRISTGTTLRLIGPLGVGKGAQGTFTLNEGSEVSFENTVAPMTADQQKAALRLIRPTGLWD